MRIPIDGIRMGQGALRAVLAAGVALGACAVAHAQGTLVVSIATDPTGVPLEWSEDRYLGSAVAFTVHNSVAVSALSRLPAH